ncbi:Mad3/BUB1 homology region 1-domain-containing protein [Fusarium flagelliforme]|uniref:Mad3/BUB1 homology region 1-domain-containing protein n=1 Tax=Fusarium flagelliforme TaxID=2675880 RepID=UPI001E8D1967|nr:Mad3/BUB1 homology region 1-domain-containing protein [Fusarium flagelliforme]KAH7197699.1 Mad3/BUB1 homology region 1-domain-containing protein [Fusarium flagelliforme]
MSSSGDLIDFDLIEGQKENIQSLPGGRSAKKLAELYSPSPLHKQSTPTPSDTRNVNDCIRAEFEQEVENIDESDDPLDVFERYVRWTLDAYPSAQATPQSQLHTLLERATKTFIGSAQYKNDPRYLKLWVYYIHFFSEAPRETYMFLSRHGIGESLALFYEEYAAWLEGAGRWAQAEEVYKLGIEREARPVPRLMRKFKEFEERVAQQPDVMNEPSSPALPTMRPALAAKVDPFAAARAADPQASRTSSGGAAKPGKAKMAIFSDGDAQPSAMSSMGAGSKGWDSIGSLADRKKENAMEAKPWAGETLQAGGKKSAAPKMSVFRDQSLSQIQNIVVVPSKHQISLHPQTGKKERVFVDLAAIYPTPEEIGTELSFEEIIAANRGWLGHCWEEESIDESIVPEPAAPLEIEEISKGLGEKLMIHQDPVDKIPIHKDSGDKLMIRPDPVGKMAIHKDPVDKLVIHQDSSTKLAIHKDSVQYDENGRVIEQPRPPRGSKKKKMMEVNETQIIKAKLDSPSRPKLKKKNTSEPTMTLHTKAATDDIYDIFNAPLQPTGQEEESADEDDYESDDNYTTDAESTGTTRQIEPSEAGDDDNDEDAKSISEWSDFSTRRHIPNIDGEGDEDGDERNDTQVSAFIDTAAPEHEQDSTKALDNTDIHSRVDEEQDEDEELGTPVSEDFPPQPRTTFVPIPPEDYEPPTRPYRDPAEVANNRLPFMTPITERTEVSLDVTVERHEYKTPCKRESSMTIDEEDEEDSDLEALSSPIRGIVNDVISPPKMSVPLAPKSAGPLGKSIPSKPLAPKGPIIKDTQCNPVDEVVRSEIIAKMLPPLSSYSGFYDHRDEKYERGGEIRKFAKALTKASKSGERTSSISTQVVIELPEIRSTYTIKKELGAGAFAPVYLVENSAPEADENDENAVPTMGKGAFAINHRSEIEALKMENPPTPWEFHMMRLAHTRLGPQHRASASLSYAHEMHLYQDEAFLFLPYHPHGTLLDVVNFFRAEPSAVMDEQLAMFFTIELLRTVESLHSKSVMHGDLKADNCLLRLDALSDDESLTSQWKADGSGGWSSRGIVLIDFGRGIDMRAFVPEVEFIADWKTSAQDCAEMREGRPWTWQIDYHGLAGTIHTLLFGKYIETMRCDQGGLGKSGRRYKIRESLKRYWQTDLWSDCFEILLNPGVAAAAGGEEGGQMPVLKSMKSVRERMETWLEANCERGVGLKSIMGKLEATFGKNRK